MTTPHRTLLQQALDALRQCEFTSPPAQRPIVKDAIAALREALAADHLRDVAEKVAPAAPAQPAVRHVRKVGGSFQHTGTVVAEFRTAAGEPRIVLEFDAPVTGMLHVYRPDQVEPCEPVAPAAPPAAPAPAMREPLTDEQLARIAVEDEFLLYCDQDSFNEIARAIEAAHGITGASK